MKKNVFSIWLAIKTLAFLLFLVPLTYAFESGPPAASTCTEPAPQLNQPNSNTVTFNWQAVLGASGYEVKYASGSYKSPVYFTTGTSITFSELSSGTYNFYFRTVCGKQTSDWIITEDLILK
ncbi:MAG: hypothetical protein AAFZ15_17675 [Bacteroidota bacterium]